MTNAHLYVMRHAPYKLLKRKIDRDCLHSMNALALGLEDLQGGKPLVLSFR
jgi:hypothetical protein